MGTGASGLHLGFFSLFLSAFRPLPSSGFFSSRGLLENVLLKLLLSPSLFQFDGESAYVGMSDGNPELLSTSQVGAPSFLSGQLALG